MPTPTFPEQRPNAPTAPPLTATLDTLRAGPVRAEEVARLSDLSREAARTLAVAWPGLPEPVRVAVVRRMDELCEERIDLSFGRALRVALDDESPVVRQLAVAALWEDERSDLPDRLLALIADDPSEDVRAEAARGLGRFADRAAAGELDEVAGRRLRTALAAAAGEASPHGLRRRALESVGAFAGEDVRSLIQAAYDSEEHDLQASSLVAMGRSMDPRWVGIVLEELQSPEAELRFEAARASGALGDDRAVPELAPLCQDPDAEVRFAAIGALGQIGGRSAVKILRLLADGAEEADAEMIDAALEEALDSLEPLRVGQ